MFKLVVIEETIMVPPRLFGFPRLQALEHMVNKTFSDKVIGGVGLCVALWDWVRVGEDKLVMQSGESSTVCVFRMVVFAPFEGEVVFSRISASHETGVFVEMGFFDSVHVPKARLPVPCEWDAAEKVWIWRPDFGGGDEGAGQGADGEDGAAQALYMDVSNECVFRVVEVQYEDRWSVPPSERDVENRSSAMSVIGSLYDEALQDNQGLGDPLWWYEDGEGEGEEGAVGDDEGGEGEGGEGDGGVGEGEDMVEEGGEYGMGDGFVEGDDGVDEGEFVEEDELVQEGYDRGEIVGAEDD